jgi:hypothetical protein
VAPRPVQCTSLKAIEIIRRNAEACRPLKIACELWKKTRPTRAARTAEQPPIVTATATRVTMTQTAARGDPLSIDAATSLENPEANRQ